MNKDQLRNKLAPLTRGQSIKFQLPKLEVEVSFTKSGDFVVTSSDPSSGSVFTHSSLNRIVQYMYGVFFTPRSGQVYQHVNSNIYTVIAIANEHSLRPEYPPSVVYQGENGLVWVKPLTNFLAKMTRIK